MFNLFDKDELRKESRIEFDLDSGTGPNCAKCGAYLHCRSPKMKHRGNGRKNILALAEAPGPTEDQRNTQLVGDVGQFLQGRLDPHRMLLDRDFYKLNAMNCFPNKAGKIREPTNTEIANCRPIVLATIKKLQPKHIWLFGSKAVASIYGEDVDSLTITQMRGLCIPDQELRAFVHPMFHPSFVSRKGKDDNLQSVFNRDIANAVAALSYDEFPVEKEPVPRILYDFKEIMDVLLGIHKARPEYFYFDYETTGLKPQFPNHKIVSMSFCCSPAVAYSFPLSYRSHFTDEQRKAIIAAWNQILTDPNIKKQANNMKFEDAWSRNILEVRPDPFNFDPMLAAHILDSRDGHTGLKFCVFKEFGVRPYDNDVKTFMKATTHSQYNRIEEAPLDKLLRYNALDSYYGRRLAILYEQQINDTGNLPQAYDFLHETNLVLSDVQENGIPIDEEYYHKRGERLKKRMVSIQKALDNSDEATEFQHRYHHTLKWTSPIDLRRLIYEMLGAEKKFTDKGNLSVDVSVLESLDIPIIKQLMKLRKYEKIVGTYFAQFQREVCRGKMHPFIDTNTAISYRSNVFRPPMQQIPKRDEMMQRECRSGINPSEGYVLAEPDYKQIEVCASACYHKDKNMIAYIRNKSTDMHRDTASDTWMLPQSEITKDIRFFSKNCWVFPQFYGSYYAQCAPDLWNSVYHLETASGIPIKEHLQSKGIHNYSQFEEHCKEVERIFWNERFPEYKQWKKDINKFFIKHGYVETLLGFRCSGYLNERDATNHQIQGTAYHLMQWALNRTHRWMVEEGMKSQIIMETHDSMLFNLAPDERVYIYKYLHHVGTVEIRNEFPWIIVPLEIEFEETEVNANWYTKKEVDVSEILRR